MSLVQWVKQRSQKHQPGCLGKATCPRGQAFRPQAEPLEDRVVLNGTPALVVDLNPGSQSTFTSALVGSGDLLYFPTNDGVHGPELWKSDGTAAGTVLVKDIIPGPDGWYLDNMTDVNGTLFFVYGDPTHGGELWRTDGTAAGTVLVKDIQSGAAGSYPGQLRNIQGTLYFLADDGVHGQELWKSDGTAAGTVLVKDLNPGPGDASAYLPFRISGTMFFSAYGDSDRAGLWKSDGTAEGTVRLADLTSVYHLEVNGTLFFKANDGIHGYELWKSDGTPEGTVLVQDIVPGAESSAATPIAALDGNLYFLADDGIHGMEIWKTDGSGTGTVLLQNLHPGPEATYASAGAVVNGVLLISVSSSWTAASGFLPGGLFKTDGTAAGSGFLVQNDIYPGFVDPSALTVVNDTMYFRWSDRDHGQELWKSDGTVEGTVRVADIYLGTESGYPNGLTFVHGKLFFGANDGTHGSELWALDITAPSALQGGQTQGAGFNVEILAASDTRPVETQEPLPPQTFEPPTELPLPPPLLKPSVDSDESGGMGDLTAPVNLESPTEPLPMPAEDGAGQAAAAREDFVETTKQQHTAALDVAFALPAGFSDVAAERMATVLTVDRSLDFIAPDHGLGSSWAGYLWGATFANVLQRTRRTRRSLPDDG